MVVVFHQAFVAGFDKTKLAFNDAKRVLDFGPNAGFQVFDMDGHFVFARVLFQGANFTGTFGYQPINVCPLQLVALVCTLVACITGDEFFITV
ncbi:Uncharacterised protein [Vibrio cholerae]|nr:Uncharacterised protein [Vibrio cholerae]